MVVSSAGSLVLCFQAKDILNCYLANKGVLTPDLLVVAPLLSSHLSDFSSAEGFLKYNCEV